MTQNAMATVSSIITSSRSSTTITLLCDVHMLLERHMLIPTHQIYITCNYESIETLAQLATTFIMSALLYKPWTTCTYNLQIRHGMTTYM